MNQIEEKTISKKDLMKNRIDKYPKLLEKIIKEEV